MWPLDEGMPYTWLRNTLDASPHQRACAVLRRKCRKHTWQRVERVHQRRREGAGGNAGADLASRNSSRMPMMSSVSSESTSVRPRLNQVPDVRVSGCSSSWPHAYCLHRYRSKGVQGCPL